MKQDMKGKKTIQYFSVLVMVVVVALISMATNSQADTGESSISRAAISDYLAVQQNPDSSDEEKIKAAIDAYFTLLYEGQKSLVPQDFSPLLEDKTLDWVKLEQDKREIELYIGSLFNLAYQDYKFTLDYDSIEINADQAKVSLRQNHQVTYRVDPTHVSGLAGLVHTITLQKKNDVWRIYRDEYEDEYTRLLETTSKNEIMKQVYENYLIGQQERITLPEDPQPLPAHCSSYNRTAAKGFANQYAEATAAPIPAAVRTAYQATYSVPYPSGWPQYYKVETEEDGGDCTNFASQAVFVGTNYNSGDTNYFYPYPFEGMNENNWYYKFSPDAEGSTVWKRVGVPEGQNNGFYNFLTNTNAGKRGPFGVIVESWNLCTGISVGDPIFMKNGVNWQHTVIVDSFWKNGCYSPGSHIYVDSHTPNRKAVALGTFAYSWTGVHIQGYNAYTFTDVPPTHWAWQNIERLYASGITAGCGSGNYCPGDSVTRAQMAIFLLRGIHGSGYTPPTATGGVFYDVPREYWAAAWIEQLFREGITAGCGNGNYCPERATTHAEMAIFLLRSKFTSSYTPTHGTYTRFSDVPQSHWAAAWIKEADEAPYGVYGIYTLQELILDGCSQNGQVRFCLDAPVTRALMAGLMVRTFDLP